MFVKHWFHNEAHLKQWVPANWSNTRICIALSDLHEQAEHALALLAQVGTTTYEEGQWLGVINGYIMNIKYNQSILNCSLVQELKIAQERRTIEAERTKEELNKLYWQTMLLRWKMTKDIGNNIFRGTKWLIQTVHENSAPIISGAMALFIYNKIFGLTQRR